MSKLKRFVRYLPLCLLGMFVGMAALWGLFEGLTMLVDWLDDTRLVMAGYAVLMATLAAAGFAYFDTPPGEEE